MFGIGQKDFDMHTNRIVAVENAVGMLCPRVSSLEHWVSAIQTKLSDAEARTIVAGELGPQGPRTPEAIRDKDSPVASDHVDITQYTGMPTASLSLPCPAPAQAPTPEALVSLTAGMAEGAPVYRDEPPLFDKDGTSHGQHPATAISRLNLLEKAVAFKHGSRERGIHGVQQPDGSTIEVLGTPRATPPSTPRIHGNVSPPIEEPIWGKQYLQFQAKISSLERERAQDRETLDVLAKMVGDCATCVTGIGNDWADKFQGMCSTTTAHLEAVLDSKQRQLQDQFDHLETVVKEAEASMRTQKLVPRGAAPPKFGADDPWHGSSACAPDPWHAWGQREPEDQRSWACPSAAREAAPPQAPQSFLLHGQMTPDEDKKSRTCEGFDAAGIMTSPLQQTYSSPLGAAIHSGRILPSETIPQVAWDPKEWKINPKVDKDMIKFDNKPEAYRNWSNRIRDHLVAEHQPWGRLLDVVEKARIPLTFSWLAACPGIDGARLDLPWLSRHLWTFLGNRLGDSIYVRRIQVAGGEESNGLELWRRIFMENEGGAEQVALAGLRRLHSFPKCPSKERLGTYLGDWQHLRNKHGASIPDESLFVMLLNMLPEDVAKEVRDRKQVLNTTQAVLDYVYGELARYNDKHLSQLQEKMDMQALARGPQNAVYSCVEDKVRSLEQKIDAMIHAVGPPQPAYPRPPRPTKGDGKGKGGTGSRLARPDPAWPGGCWHCGKTHAGGRRQCNALKALIKKHNGLPKDYKGAYEVWLEENKKPHAAVVAALQVAQEECDHVIASLKPAQAEEPAPAAAAEHAETQQPRFFAMTTTETSHNPFVHPTQWDEFANTDDDHNDLIEAFSELTSNITTGPPQTQRQRKGILKAPRLTPERIAAIAQDINDGKLTLPEVECAHDSDYIAIWALVDSGSTVHAIDAEKLLPKAKRHPPPRGHSGFKAANGGRIPHRGFVDTVVKLQEGDIRTIRWSDTKVELPILSTQQLARNGSKLEYDETEGHVIDKQTGHRNRFIAAAGTYFIQLMVPKNLFPEDLNAEDFGRPGP